jgi:DNA-directed RNA polymerase specialized sigma subunit
MGEQILPPHGATSENQTPAFPEVPVQVFDFDALKQQFLVDGTWGTLTALDEVELGFMVQDGLHASSVLNARETLYMPLDPGEEHELTATAQRGHTALDIFVRANEGMVRKVAYAVKQHYADVTRLESKDVRQQARFYLTDSAKKFDPAMGVKFSSFAQQYMYVKLLGWARDTSRLIRVSRSMADKVDAFRVLVMQGKTEEEAAAQLSLSVKALLAAESAAKWPDAISYDEAYTEDDTTDASLIEILRGPHEDIPHDELIADAVSASAALTGLRGWILKYVTGKPGSRNTDPYRGQKLFLAHYMRDVSFEELGETWGISATRIGQIIRQVIKEAEEPPKEIPPNPFGERAYRLMLGRYVGGKNFTELGEEWGISRERASQIVRETEEFIDKYLPPSKRNK